MIPFDSPAATLETAGGKGLNLVRLTRAGFPVPRGFIVPTAAYRAFVDSNNLAGVIDASIAGMAEANARQLEASSANIRAAFAAGKMPVEIESAIREAYQQLGQRIIDDGPHNRPSSVIRRPLSTMSVAVRSSATAEDLPDLSFAGQQDTYLNVMGVDALLEAVVGCWSSLWTARAIGYRLRNHIGQEQAALAVAVQEMVQSDVSGVLFSANPLAGLRSESVIDATLGLGEALVSGQVEPDHYVVETVSRRIVGKTLGQKKISTRGKAGGGVEVVPEDAGARQALSDDEIRQLAALGQAVQEEYGSPQDIEWAFAGGKLYLLQARAITSLFPVPEMSLDPLKVWFSFGSVQGMLAPITPLGLETLQSILAGGARLFGAKIRYDATGVFEIAGQRLWIKISDVMRHPVGSKIYKAILPVLEPSIGAILRALSVEAAFGEGKGKIKAGTLLRLARFAIPVLGRVLRTMYGPEQARARFQALIERELAVPPATPAETPGDMRARLAARVQFLEERMTNAFPVFLPRFAPMMAPSITSLALLTELAAQADAGSHGIAPLVLEATRGLPHNVTTEMDLALWETAQRIRRDPGALEHIRVSTPAQLAGEYLAGSLPLAAQTAIADFMARYGMRGVGEIDIGRPRWREEPGPIMQTIQSYLNIDEALAPDVLFARGALAAEQAIEKLAAAARRQHGGWLKEKLVRFASRRMRILMGLRESPKFFMVRIMGVAREALLASGTEFVQAGVLERPDDLFFLRIADLKALARDEARDWKSLVAGRRESYVREERRRQVPRVLVSDGRAFYEGLGTAAEAGGVIDGSPVSPGVVEGVVHVVFDPNTTQLAPGEILVCPGTDPAWTPLFMAAGGLVTEVGGMMTHGSVVAREYGIPAVVGVHQATERLKTGQRVRVDGTAGKIVVLG